METSAKLESILFSLGRPEAIAKVAKSLGLSPKEAEEAIVALQKRYQEQGSGLAVLVADQKVQLVTSPASAKLVADLAREELEGPLSKAAMETLAIIAYRGPLTKPEIDTIRGVNSGIMLRTLLIRGLVARKRSTTDARTFSYEMTPDFMRFLGITQQQELPQHKEYSEQKVITQLAEQARQEQELKATGAATAATATAGKTPAPEATSAASEDAAQSPAPVTDEKPTNTTPNA